MKKNNIITFFAFCILVIAVVIFSSGINGKKENTDLKKETPENSIMKNTTSKTESNTTIPSENGSSETVSKEATSNNPHVEPVNMSDTLFIGDSRTVGIMEYAGLNDANFFCSTGLSVFNVYQVCVSVPTVGKVTLAELLSLKKYDRIYVMLGINELGYSFQSIIDNYGKLIEFVKSNQPDADIIIQANLHVSKKRSESDKYYNNVSINRLNSEISKFKDNKKVFYLDANYLFDDENGNLSADKTADDAHLYGKYYVEWGEWIQKETAKLVKEG